MTLLTGKIDVWLGCTKTQSPGIGTVLHWRQDVHIFIPTSPYHKWLKEILPYNEAVPPDPILYECIMGWFCWQCWLGSVKGSPRIKCLVLILVNLSPIYWLAVFSLRTFKAFSRTHPSSVDQKMLDKFTQMKTMLTSFWVQDSRPPEQHSVITWSQRWRTWKKFSRKRLSEITLLNFSVGYRARTLQNNT